MQKNHFHHKYVYYSVLLVIFINLFVYSNSLHERLVWDDYKVIFFNNLIKSWANVPQILNQPIGQGSTLYTPPQESHVYYRPLQIVSYILDHSIWGDNVAGYHITNILLHIAATLALYWLVIILFDDLLLALFTALFFSIYPTQNIIVNYLSSRADSLVLFFMLTALIFYIKFDRSGRYSNLSIALLLFLLSFLSKDNSLIFPGLLLTYHYSFNRNITARAAAYIITLFIALLVFRFSFLHLLPHQSTLLLSMRRIPGFLSALPTYARILIMPFNITIYYTIPSPNLFIIKLLCGAGILCLLIYTLLQRANISRIYIFSASWFLITFFPVANVVYPLHFAVSEHYLYIPSIAVFLVAANLFCIFFRKRRLKYITPLTAIALLCFFSLCSLKKNLIWDDPLQFYHHLLRCSPRSYEIYNNLGIEYEIVNDNEKAIHAYKNSIFFRADNPKAYFNLGCVYLKSGQADLAKDCLQTAIRLNPLFAPAYYFLARIHYGSKEYDLALSNTMIALKLKYTITDRELLNLLRDEYPGGKKQINR